MLHLAIAGHPIEDSDPLLSSSEIDHRIANNLALIASLVRLRANNAAATVMMTGADAATVLKDAADQIDAVARLHRFLSQHPGESMVGVVAFLRELCSALSATIVTAADMSLTESYAGDLNMPRDKALPIALIVSEVVTNAAKYAHPSGVSGTVSLGCTITETGRLRLEIEDDGVGLPDHFDPFKDGGLGFRVIRALTRQIGATFAFSSNGLGLCFALDL